MREGWRTVKLEDVCYLDKQSFTGSDLPYIGMENIEGGTGCFHGSLESRDVKSNTFHFKPTHLLYGRLRPYLNKVLLPEVEGHCSTEIFPIQTKAGLQKKFLFYWLTSTLIVDKINKTCTGARMPRANFKEVLKFNFPLPPLEEQKRIVAILDEAFEGIEKAVANAEKNLVNARQLFESYLNSIFTKKGEGWRKNMLSEICVGKITDGTHQTPKYFNEGHIFLSSKNVTSGLIDWENVKYLDDRQHMEMQKRLSPQINDILLAKNGTTGVAAIVDKDIIFDIYVSLALLRPSEKIIPRFLWHFINSPVAKKQFNKRLKGIGVPNLHLKEIREVVISYPEKLAEQEAMVTDLDKLLEYRNRLEEICQKKLTALAELKQSILQKAFSGELTLNNKVVAFPASQSVKETESLSPEFTANILAFAYHRHASKKRNKTFGRVKAQKTLHLVESVGGVELGRNPIKDAAGPNDFQHMLRAEDWAKANQFFEFVSRGEDKGYDFEKLARYDELMAGVFATIKSYQDKLERVIDLVIPKNSRETELLATVYAAWNNLVLDGCEITDEAIIREARENWHSEKMKIPVAEFQKAIRIIRNKGLVPDGKAKRVGGQESLF